jgi:hypothetical protein
MQLHLALLGGAAPRGHLQSALWMECGAGKGLLAYVIASALFGEA